MDLDEWEYLPDDAFLDFHEEKEDKRIFSSSTNSNSKTVFNMNYYIIPSPNSRPKAIDPPPPPPPPMMAPKSHQLLLPIQLELPPPKFIQAAAAGAVQEETVVTKPPAVAVPAADGEDQDTVLSQVYFKKTWESNEFVDMMKIESPKSPTCRSGSYDQGGMESKISSPRMIKVSENNSFLEAEEREEDGDKEKVDGGGGGGDGSNGNNIWKVSLNGIGAICSFGLAAATICVLFFGTHQGSKQYQHNQNRFQIYTDDSKAVQHATKLNDAFSAVRGVPLTRAHVTFGGYYNGL